MEKKIKKLTIGTIIIICILLLLGFVNSFFLYVGLGALLALIPVVIMQIYDIKKLKTEEFKPKISRLIINLIIYGLILLISISISIYMLIGAVGILTIYRNITVIIIGKSLAE